MDKPIFLVDVDGVLRDITTPMLKLYNAEFEENLTYSDLKNYDVSVSFPKFAEQQINARDFFFNDCAAEVFLSAPLMENAFEAISILRETGRVIICTNQSTTKNKIYTLKWLKSNNIEYDDIFFTSDKSLIPCNVIIDDNPYFIDHSNANTRIIINHPYNQDVKENDRTMRFDSLYDYAIELKTINQMIRYV